MLCVSLFFVIEGIEAQTGSQLASSIEKLLARLNIKFRIWMVLYCCIVNQSVFSPSNENQMYEYTKNVHCISTHF